MASLCDDLRQLDRMLLGLSKGSTLTPQTNVLLWRVRKHVQELEKRARALDSILGLTPWSDSGTGGAAPLCYMASVYGASQCFTGNCNGFDCSAGLNNSCFIMAIAAHENPRVEVCAYVQ